ncbi:MAG: D-alanyl-D-alanine carboxypeptidase, partial [Pseudomonadota bacterium]|nr:D-alanyl-D-alanine carboxypeptidase [Pseudomonadota bacterium]
MALPARRAFQNLIAMLTSLLMMLAPLGAAHAEGIFGAPRYSAIVVDAATGEVLYAKRADYQRFPASLTKIMTLYMAFEAMATGRLSAKDTIVMSQHGASMQPSKLGLRAGEGVTLDMAMQAIAVKSAND